MLTFLKGILQLHFQFKKVSGQALSFPCRDEPNSTLVDLLSQVNWAAVCMFAWLPLAHIRFAYLHTAIRYHPVTDRAEDGDSLSEDKSAWQSYLVPRYCNTLDGPWTRRPWTAYFGLIEHQDFAPIIGCWLPALPSVLLFWRATVPQVHP